jgi:hypothetical protein
MNYLHLFEAWTSKIKTENFDKVLTDLTDLIKGEEKLIMWQKKSLISDIFGMKDKELSEIKSKLWDKESKTFNNKSDFNSFVSKVHLKIKDFNPTKFKQLLKALRSNTTGRKSK